MKKQHSQVLADHLAEVDSELLDNAYAVDDAEKLKKYAEIKRAKTRKPFYRTPIFLRTVAAAAGLVVMIGGVSLFIHLSGIRSAVSECPPWYELEGLPQPGVDTDKGTRPNKVPSTLPEDFLKESVVFDSLDKVNYYGGLMALSENHNEISADGMGFAAVTFLPTSGNQGYALIPLGHTTETSEEDMNSDPGPQPGDEDWTGSVGSWDISGERLTITTAIFFELDVTESHEFLAEKVGVGRVRAVITDLEIGLNPYAMITFKNGDRFFSCLTEGDVLREDENLFWTHLYIKGFEMYKDTTEGISHFLVEQDPDTGEVLSVSWIPYNRIPTEALRYPYDVVPESTCVSAKMDYEFSLLELDRYFNGTDGESAIPSNQIEKVTVHTADGMITPICHPLWREYYDREKGNWKAEYLGAPSLPVEGPNLPVLTLSEGEVSVSIEGAGTLGRQTAVYFKDSDGRYVRYDDFNGIVGNMDDLLTVGEWYVVFEVEWRDEYIPEEYMYERHMNEYWFKLVVVE